MSAEASRADLLAEVERLRADAERYRWPRMQSGCMVAHPVPGGMNYIWPGTGWLFDEVIDAAIDSANQGESK